MMPSNSLSLETKGTGKIKHLLKRSCLVVFAVLTLLVVISFLPHSRKDAVLETGASQSEECAEDATLRHLHVVHRHGERTPIHWFGFEGDWGWENESLAPGKLTVVGMQHAYQVGQKLAQLYNQRVKFASSTEIAVFSTDYDRTVDTVKSLLLGIYSEPDTPTYADRQCSCRKGNGTRSSAECIATCIGLDANNLPDIPQVIVRDRSDPAFHQANVCSGWKQWIESLEASASWKAAADKQFPNAEEQLYALADSETVRALSWPDGNCEGCANIHDPKFNPINLIEQVWSNLECFMADNKTYNDKASNSEILVALQPVADFSWHHRYTSAKGNLTGGMLLDEMITKLKDVAKTSQCHPSRQCEGSGASATIYSAHDTTVYSVLAALGAAEQLPIPRFASHLRMELWERTGCPVADRFEVRLFYDSNVEGSSIYDKLSGSPACPGGSCSLDSFYKKTRSGVIPVAQCQPEQNPLVTDALGSGCCDHTAAGDEL